MLLSTTFESLRSRSTEIRYGGVFIRSEASPSLGNEPQALGLKYDIDLMLSVQGDSLIAVFRSADTVDALKTSNTVARRVLEESGFTLLAVDSGIPTGYFLRREVEDRGHLLKKLLKKLTATDDETLEWGEFDLSSKAYCLSTDPSDLEGWEDNVYDQACPNKYCFDADGSAQPCASEA